MPRPALFRRHPLSRALPLALALVCLLAACQRADIPVYHDQFFAFGTLIDLTIYDVDTRRAEQASQTLEQAFTRMHSDWHAWQPGALQQLNTELAEHGRASADPSLVTLIREANRLSTLSDGLFNPLIGHLVALWGFHDDEPPTGPPPAEDAIRQLREQAPTSADVRVDGLQISSRNPAVRYDLGAFAKGYAIDRGIERLQELEIDHAIINAGGDLRATGRHGERPWRIGIRDPHKPGVLASIELSSDESVFTSGDYERFYEYQGQRYHHIIDPRSGYPAGATVSATVIHPVAATADAAATALFVAGPQAWPAIARQLGVKYVMLVDREGKLHMNPAMQARLAFETEPDTIVMSEAL
jgi:thiamine biosynthesis lipoprotein